MKKFLSLSLSIALIMAVFLPMTSFAAEGYPQGKIISYIAGWADWTADDVQGDRLTHLYISFARIDNNFKISDKEERLTVEDKKDYPLPDLVSTELISEDVWRELAEVKARYPHLKLIIAVGGWAAEGFSDMAATKATREIFVDSAVEYIKNHNLDGIDLDWEFPVNGAWGVIKSRPEDRENFTELIKLLRQKLGDDKEISFCANVSGWFMDAVDLPALAPIIDSVNLMSYDMQGAWHENTDHHTNLYPNEENPFVNWGLSCAEAIERLIDAGVPPEKLIMGIATYGREFNGAEPGPNGDGLFQSFNKEDPTVWRGGTVPFTAIDNYYVNKNGFMRYWDDSARAPYLYSADEKIFITYEDAESITEKVHYAKSKGLAGIMYWEYTSDLSGKLLASMYDAMNNSK